MMLDVPYRWAVRNILILDERGGMVTDREVEETKNVGAAQTLYIFSEQELTKRWHVNATIERSYQSR